MGAGVVVWLAPGGLGKAGALTGTVVDSGPSMTRGGSPGPY
ncbi:hypothetical protein ACIO1C_18405 [Streptomyces sp. NPDC087420]